VEQSRLSRRLGAEDGDEMVVEASVGDPGELEVGAQVIAADASAWHASELRGGRRGPGEGIGTHLNTLSSSTTWIPCSNFFALGSSSPTAAKCPFMLAITKTRSKVHVLQVNAEHGQTAARMKEQVEAF